MLKGIEGFAVVSSGDIAAQSEVKDIERFREVSGNPPGDMDMFARDQATLSRMYERLQNDERVINLRMRQVSGVGGTSYILEATRLIDLKDENGKPVKVAEEMECFAGQAFFGDEEYRKGEGVEEVWGMPVFNIEALRHGYAKRREYEVKVKDHVVENIVGPLVRLKDKHPERFETLKSDLRDWEKTKEKNQKDEGEDMRVVNESLKKINNHLEEEISQNKSLEEIGRQIDESFEKEIKTLESPSSKQLARLSILKEDLKRRMQGAAKLHGQESFLEFFEKKERLELLQSLNEHIKAKEPDFNWEKHRDIGLDRLDFLSPQVFYDFYNDLEKKRDLQNPRNWEKWVKLFTKGKHKYKESRVATLEAIKEVTTIQGKKEWLKEKK